MTDGAPSRAALIAAGVAVGLAGLYGIGYAVTGNSMPPNTTIGGVGVGGLTPDAAQRTLRDGLASTTGQLTLKVGEETVTKTADELGLAVDYPRTIAEAGGRKTLNPAEMLADLVGGRSLEPVTKIDQAKLTARLGAIAATDHGPSDAAIAYEGTTPKLTPARAGRALSTLEAADALTRSFPRSATIDLPVTSTAPAVTTAEGQQILDGIAKPAVSGPVTLTAGVRTAQLPASAIASALSFTAADGVLRPTLDAGKLNAAAPGLDEALGGRSPVDARIRLGSDGPDIVGSADGVGLTADALAAAVQPVLTRTTGRTASVVMTPVKPTFSTADAQKLGVKEVTGEFTTKFPGAYPYRYVNIPKAAGLVNGVFVLPGETFSLNEALGGERTLEKGWAAGFGINEGSEAVVPGGGISQVTTTLYNALFFAGLEDVAHKPHSLYFSRYPQGREATLSWPYVDLQFRNDSPYGVLLESSTTGHPGVDGTITVKVWSTKQYDVKQANTAIANNLVVTGTAPAPDNSATCVAQEAADGFDIRFDRQFWQAGKLVKSVPYFWHYNTLKPTVCTNPEAIVAEKARQNKPSG